MATKQTTTAAAQLADPYPIWCDVWLDSGCAWADEAKLTGGCPNGAGARRGSEVRAVQTILWAHGLLASTQVDGIWGPITDGATRTWQRDHFLSVDGCVGAQTWSKMQTGSHVITVGPDSVRIHHLTYANDCSLHCHRHEYYEGSKRNGRTAIFMFDSNLLNWYFYPPNGGFYQLTNFAT